LNPPIKRLLALAGSIVAGLFGTIVLASPAQAHHPIISGWAACQADGQYKISWKVENGNWFGRFMKIVVVDPTPDPTADLPFTGDIKVGAWVDPNGKVEGTQFVSGSATSASLYIDAKWYQSKTNPRASVKVHENRTGEVKLAGTCKAEENPSASFDDRCDGTVNVTLVNPTTTTKTFRVNDKQVDVTSAEKQKDVLVAAGAGKITVTVKSGDIWKPVKTHDGWVRPEGCAPPEVATESTCEEFSIAVTNAENNLPFKFKVTYGTQTTHDPDWVEVKAGETKEVKFVAGAKTEAKVEFTNDWPSQTVTFVKPTTCETLPQTGSNTSTLIASGTGLAMLGGLAFFFARRRSANLRKLAAS
jgi:LPXTG-motif cell wall-anchored protein